MRVPRPPHSEDTISFLHPSAVYYPKRFCGYKYWVGFTLNNGIHTNEYPFIRCSNDLITWDSFPGAPSMLFYPLTDYPDSHGLIPAYWSDVFLFPGDGGKLWCGIRGWYDATGHVCLWVTSTSDGATWTKPVKIFEDSSGSQNNARWMSPCVFRDTSGAYRMWAVNADYYGRIVRLGAPSPDSGWAVIDTVKEHGAVGQYADFPAGTSTDTQYDDSIWTGKYCVWHLGLVEVDTEQTLVLLTARRDSISITGHAVLDRTGTLTGRPGNALFVGVMTDGGAGIKLRYDPLLLNNPVDRAFDWAYPYRACGWVEGVGQQMIVRMLYTGFDKSHYRVGLTSIQPGH
ncbi:hypothetical protein C3F09_03905 [candidate division GN15 bacterium]|uniref:Glycosyl hydrolase family 32 N-terminal domain-containing protein n=1 Tax=candidate division GN15 bacterium TaxID=2072418 RepID=A0A855X538_9BACT|nr:MAG: hypothetical protein C3F09_03905 [candidate division GN15 bacterium]